MPKRKGVGASAAVRARSAPGRAELEAAGEREERRAGTEGGGERRMASRTLPELSRAASAPPRWGSCPAAPLWLGRKEKARRGGDGREDGRAASHRDAPVRVGRRAGWRRSSVRWRREERRRVADQRLAARHQVRSSGRAAESARGLRRRSAQEKRIRWKKERGKEKKEQIEKKKN